MAKPKTKLSGLGAKMDQARRRRSLTVRSIAREMDVGEQTIYQWFYNRRQPSPAMLLKYAEVVGIEYHTLEAFK